MKQNAELQRVPSPLPVNVAVTTTDEQARRDLATTRQELTEARAQIANLQASTSKARRFADGDRTSAAKCLAAHQIPGKVKLRPAVTDSEAVEYADELARLLTDAGFDVVNFAGTFDSDSVLSWGFTGERMLLNDAKRPPAHALVIQKCFRDIGRTMAAQTDTSVETNTVLIAIGGRP